MCIKSAFKKYSDLSSLSVMRYRCGISISPIYEIKCINWEQNALASTTCVLCSDNCDSRPVQIYRKRQPGQLSQHKTENSALRNVAVKLN